MRKVRVMRLVVYKKIKKKKIYQCRDILSKSTPNCLNFFQTYSQVGTSTSYQKKKKKKRRKVGTSTPNFYKTTVKFHNIFKIPFFNWDEITNYIYMLFHFI